MCFPLKFAKFLRTPFLTEPLRSLLLRAPNFVSMSQLCTIQNNSNSLAKAHLITPFLQNSFQWLLWNVSYFFLKGKNRNNFHTSSDLNTLEILQLHQNYSFHSLFWKNYSNLSSNFFNIKYELCLHLLLWLHMFASKRFQASLITKESLSR